MNRFELGKEKLEPSLLASLAKVPSPPVQIKESQYEHAAKFRSVVENIITKNKTVYGINTGFGLLSDVAISADALDKLQINLVRSHACGVGEFISLEASRALLILRLHTLLIGHSGVTRECLETLLAFLRLDILPAIPCKGSVGASGDLAPLSHLALALVGEGKVFFKGYLCNSADALKECKLAPLILKAKEGLSLINGTHFMTALGALAYSEAEILAKSADIIASASLDAIRGTLTPFNDAIHELRPHQGQRTTAANILFMFEGKDEIMESHAGCGKVQDAYSFRCIPQVHGATRDALTYVEKALTTEPNSVTDNPLVFLDGKILSGGNFHGQAIALACDFLGIAVAELGSISERRTEKMTNPVMSGLPPFVINDSGLNSGFMIPHVVAAALVSENKVLSHPASVDSIPTSADKEDHVSMGPIAARKALEINKNVCHVLAIELITACQALDLLKPLKPAKAIGYVHDKVRTMCSYMAADRSIHQDIEVVSQFIISGGLLNLLEEKRCNEIR